MKRFFVIILFSGFFGFSPADAREGAQPQVTWLDYRVMGLGGAFTAVADDKNALFYNPAGFASIGLKRTSIAEALINEAGWRPRYRNIPDIGVFSFGARLSTSFLGEANQKAIQTLIELGLLPADIGTMNNLYDSYLNQKLIFGWTPKTFDIFRLIKMGPFVSDPDHYGWGNLTPSQLTNLADAVNTLTGTTLSFSSDIEIFSWAAHYYGFGFFSSADGYATMNFQGLLPEPVFQIREDAIFSAGFGIPVPGYKRLHLGLALKGFVRLTARGDSYADYLDIATMDWDGFTDFGDPGEWISYILGGPSPITTPLPPQINIGVGGGFDLGALYKLKHDLSLGLRLSDVFTGIRWVDGRRSSLVPINARVGIAWKPRWYLWALFEEPLFAFDIDDLFFRYPERDNIFLKTHMGFEFKTLFKFLHIRAGLNQGYPTMGLGLDFSGYWFSKIPLVGWLRPDSVYMPQFNMSKRDHCQKHPVCCLTTGVLGALLYAHIKIDFLYYGRELGRMPGQIPDSQFALRAAFSWAY